MVVVAEAGAGALVMAVGGVDGFAGSICVGGIGLLVIETVTRRHQRSVSVHPSKCLIANESTKAGRSGSERFSPDGGEEALAVLPSTAQRLFEDITLPFLHAPCIIVRSSELKAATAGA